MTSRTYRYRQWLKYLKESGIEESFMGLIPYLDAKHKGVPVSEFQHNCFRYGSGLEKKTEEWVRNILMYNTPTP